MAAGLPKALRVRHKRERDAVHDWEGARLAVQEFGGWVKNADTKATVLAAAVGVLVAAVLSQVDPAAEALHATASPICLLASLCILLAVGLIVEAVLIYMALVPRTVGFRGSRFSWPDVASRPDPQPAGESDLKSLAEDAWAQAWTIAAIARQKYAAFRTALIVFGIDILLFAGLLLAIKS